METERRQFDPHITWAADYCKHCFTCVNVCPVKNLEFKGDEMTSLHKCTQCQLCEKYCPDFALEVEPKQAEPGKAGKAGIKGAARKSTSTSKKGNKIKTGPQKTEAAAKKSKPGAKA